MFKTITGIIIVIIGVATILYSFWPYLINAMLPADVRPERISFPVEQLTPKEYDALVVELVNEYDEELLHVDIFRDSGILAYEGPQTCLRCHRTINVEDAVTGEQKTVELMTNLTTSVHYRFYSERHPNVYGFNGELADHFPMGKINRPCPKPGSFAMTAWAAFVTLDNGDTLSEGCGQCHIGGQYAAPLGEMMPGYRTMTEEKDAIDCLICHSLAYDMNRKQVVADDNGRTRWIRIVP
jgi:hypothetical protein